jgi:hypothetical protein
MSLFRNLFDTIKGKAEEALINKLEGERIKIEQETMRKYNKWGIFGMLMKILPCVIFSFMYLGFIFESNDKLCESLIFWDIFCCISYLFLLSYLLVLALFNFCGTGYANLIIAYSIYYSLETIAYFIVLIGISSSYSSLNEKEACGYISTANLIHIIIGWTLFGLGVCSCCCFSIIFCIYGNQILRK